MKTTSATFGLDTQMSNSLVDAMLKYPEISSTLIEQYPRYALTYLLERTGRFANVKILGDKSFEWKVLGRTSQAVKTPESHNKSASANYATYAAATDTIGVDNQYLSKHDVIRVGSDVGQIIAVQSTAGTDDGVDVLKPTATQSINSATGYIYKVYWPKGHAAIAADVPVARIGSAFGEASKGIHVSEHTTYPETHKNWLTLNRRKLSISGSALTDVTWLENNGSKLWYFTAEKLFTDEFMYQLEMQRWFGVANVSSASDYPGDSGTVGGGNLMGDGILAQIDGANKGTYDVSAGLTEDKLAQFIAELSRNAKSPEGNEWVVFTGTEGRYQFHKAMKDISVGESDATGGSMQSMKTGSDVSLGVNYVSYNVLGNKMTVAYCPVFDDVNAFGNDAKGSYVTSGTGTMSGTMVFLDFSSVDGVPNIQLVAKGHDGHNRNYIKKYIPGMVNPYDQNSMLAANGDDSFTCQIMSESAVIVRNPLSCGVLSGS